MSPQEVPSWKVRVVIPALDEEQAIGTVLDSIPSRWVDSIHVGDNGSVDRTAQIARLHGARVVDAPRRGYGSACLAALADIDALDGEEPFDSSDDRQIIVFLDGDASDDPSQLPRLIDPIVRGETPLVLGSRVDGDRERGALTVQQRIGNAIATTLIRWLFGVRYRDLGPFRAIRRDQLSALQMQDPDFGWTVEMQIKAARRGWPVHEIPVPYRRRIGRSKISGTLIGSIRAGYKIVSLILFEGLLGSRRATKHPSCCQHEKG